MPVAWSENSFERLVGAIGTAAFADTLLKEAQSLTGVDEMFGFSCNGDGNPITLASSGRHGSSMHRASLYSSQFHRLDPMLPRIRRTSGRSAIGWEIRASDIEDASYRRACFDRPGLFRKITFARPHGACLYILNFYSARADNDPRAADRLSALATIALPILRRHAELIGQDEPESFGALMERRLLRAYPAMTQREVEVCARTIVGMTAEAVGIDLGISRTTVLTYRRRAYDRCGVSSAAQFLQHLLGS